MKWKLLFKLCKDVPIYYIYQRCNSFEIWFVQNEPNLIQNRWYNINQNSVHSEIGVIPKKKFFETC